METFRQHSKPTCQTTSGRWARYERVLAMTLNRLVCPLSGPALYLAIAIGFTFTAFASAQGGWLPDGAPIAVKPGEQTARAMITDGSGGAIIIWQDATTGKYAYDIFAQRVLPDGHVAAGWPEAGVPVCDEGGQQVRPRAIPDGAGGAIVVWQDVDYRWHVRLQRVGANGRPMWGWFCGVRASHFDSEQFYYGLAPDGAGGAILVWSDGRNSAPIPPGPHGGPPSYLHDIYAQRFGPDGVPLWTADGVPVCTDSLDQNGGTIITDGSGVFTIFWGDGRGGMYRQRLDLAGNVLLAANGVPVSGSTI